MLFVTSPNNLACTQVLCVYGGVYADSDVVAAKPIDAWAPDAGLLVGIENVFPTLEAAAKRTYTRQVCVVLAVWRL